MSCSLADFSPLPDGTQVPICLIEGKIQYSTPEFSNVHIYTSSVSSHPYIIVSNDQLHPSFSTEDSSRVFLPVSQSVWKKLQQTWYEKGFVPMLEIAAQPRENPDFIVLRFVAKRILTAIKCASSFYSLIPGYKKQESGEVLIPNLSLNPVYSSSNIRSIAWHPHCTKIAVAATDDSVRIYSNSSQLVPLLKCRNQRLVSCLAWRPLCTSELAVGCTVGVLLWHVDPSSVITRPSAVHTQVLTRPGHKYVSTLCWSPQGDLLVTGSPVDDTMYVWSVGLDKAVPLKRVGGGGINFLSWSPDSLKLFAATTNLVFRVWQTSHWEPDRWTVGSGRVVSATWSPCSSLVLFAVSLEPIIYALGCGSIFQSQERRAATPLIDVTPVELDSGERIGGEVASLAWDKTGHCLAVLFRGCDIIAVFMTSLTHCLNVSPCEFKCDFVEFLYNLFLQDPTRNFTKSVWIAGDFTLCICLIKGVENETPAAISFQENFKDGANLTIGWSSGRIQYFPIIFTELGTNGALLQELTPEHPNLSTFTSSQFYDYNST